jgi:hypothetical protein
VVTQASKVVASKVAAVAVPTAIKDEEAATMGSGTNEDAVTPLSEEDGYSALTDAFAGVSNLLPAMLHLPGDLQEKVVGVPLVTCDRYMQQQSDRSCETSKNLSFLSLFCHLCLGHFSLQTNCYDDTCSAPDFGHLHPAFARI